MLTARPLQPSKGLLHPPAHTSLAARACRPSHRSRPGLGTAISCTRSCAVAACSRPSNNGSNSAAYLAASNWSTAHQKQDKRRHVIVSRSSSWRAQTAMELASTSTPSQPRLLPWLPGQAIKQQVASGRKQDKPTSAVCVSPVVFEPVSAVARMRHHIHTCWHRCACMWAAVRATVLHHLTSLVPAYQLTS